MSYTMQQISKIEEGKSKETQKKEKKYLTTLTNLATKACQTTYNNIKKWISPNLETTSQQTPKPDKTNQPTKSRKNTSNNKITLRECIAEITGYMLILLLIVGAALTIFESYTDHPQHKQNELDLYYFNNCHTLI